MNALKVSAWIWTVALALGFPFHAVAVEEQQKKPMPKVEGEMKKSAAPTPTLIYKPPVRGAPGGRIGGGTRGITQTFMLSALVPNHTGLTLQEQPVLYWYLTKPISSPIEFTLTDEGIKPLLEKRLNPPFQPGIQRVRLGDYGVRLSPGKHYQWFVALVTDPERRSKDSLAGGTIERIDFPEQLSVKLSRAGKSQAPQIYAEAGLWYDALAAISDLIDAAPTDTALRSQRASLLQQGGLTEIAEYDLKPRAPE